jgi:small ligand-binding sensory domain FIST
VTAPRRFGAAVSEHPVLAQATGEILGQVLDAVGERPDLAVVFVSGHHRERLAEVVAAIRTVLAPGLLIGTTAHSVIGNAREVEDVASLSLWAGRVPGVVPVRLTATGSDGGWSVGGFPAAVTDGTLLLLADPFSFPTQEVLEGLHGHLGRHATAVPVVGGARLRCHGARAAIGSSSTADIHTKAAGTSCTAHRALFG